MEISLFLKTNNLKIWTNFIKSMKAKNANMTNMNFFTTVKNIKTQQKMHKNQGKNKKWRMMKIL
jgi:hypothetical protein